MHTLARTTLASFALGALALFANPMAARRAGAASATPRASHGNPQRALHHDPVEFAKLSSAVQNLLIAKYAGLAMSWYDNGSSSAVPSPTNSNPHFARSGQNPSAGGEVCFTLDFETDDSGAGIPHGARVNTEFDGGPIYPVTITGTATPSGDNTAAILNSSTGPAAQDPDLLVRSGNILILQNDLNESLCGPDVYCSHNDDEDGGLLTFVFNVPTTPGTIDIIDSDASDPVGIVITLFDGNGRTRTFNIPPNWTGDLVTDATSGMGTFDLTNIGPQPGFGSVAGGGETPGFDPTDVEQLRVNLGGSGAVDNLTWCQAP